MQVEYMQHEMKLAKFWGAAFWGQAYGILSEAYGFSHFMVFYVKFKWNSYNKQHEVKLQHFEVKLIAFWVKLTAFYVKLTAIPNSNTSETHQIRHTGSSVYSSQGEAHGILSEAYGN